MSKQSLVALLLISTFTFSSCVTLLGKKQTIRISASPENVRVYADGEYIGTIGTTPLVVKRKKTYESLLFAKEGYYSASTPTYTKMNGNVWWNLLFTGFIGVLVDIPYFNKYDLHSYSASLKPIPKPSTTTSTPVTAPTAEKRIERDVLERIARSYSGTEMKPKDIFKKRNSAVFMIYTSDNRNTYQGSGFFVSSDGIGISNYHVFAGTVRGGEVIKLSDGRQFRVKEVLGYSRRYDYIIFKVDGSGFNYIPVTTRECEIGEKVYAIGSPRGLQNTMSEGIVSQKRSEMILQISVPIDHGSSGGPLINAYGEVVGITSGGRDDSHANLNYAREIGVIF